MTESSFSELAAVCREDLQAFAERAFEIYSPGQTFEPNWHHEAITHALGRCARREWRRLLINQPPRTLKSYFTAIAFPAWLLGRDPTSKILITCYGDQLATTHARKIREIVQSPWYRQLFPATQLSDKNAEALFETTSGGGVRAVSTGGGITGHGFDFIIIDDPMKVQDAGSEVEREKLEDTYRQAISTRLNDAKRGVIITVMQRLHVDDFSAFLLQIGGWEHLCIPARAPQHLEYAVGPARKHEFAAGAFLQASRLGPEELDDYRRTLGSAAYEAQYQQSPSPAGGGVIKWDWFRFYDKPPAFECVFQSWDVATTMGGNNYSACTTWGYAGERWYLADVHRDQVDTPTLLKQIKRLDAQFQPRGILIESAGVGKPIVQMLRKDGMRHVHPVGVKGSKEDRLDAVTPMLERGEVYLPCTAPWLEGFRKELLGFPKGTYSDQVDSFSQFLQHFAVLMQRVGMRPPCQYRNELSVNVYGIGGPRYLRYAL